MSVGCYDADMKKYGRVPFNLELMKLSTFYKRRGEIVSLAPRFCPEKYTKFLYRKDFFDGDFNQEVFTTENVEWGGQAFSGAKYIPLNEEVEFLKPDIYLYSNMKDLFSGGKSSYEKLFHVMEKANHFRLSLDGKTIHKNFEKQFINTEPPTLFVHDFNLNTIEGSFELLRDMSEQIKVINRHAAIANKFPIQVNNREDLLKWCTLQPSARFFSLQYNGVIDTSTLQDFLALTKNTSTARILDYVVTAGNINQEQFIKCTIPELFLQICFLRKERRRITLKYDSSFFSDKRWGELLDLFNCYLNGFLYFKTERQEKSIDYDTLYSFCRSFKNYTMSTTRYPFNLSKARELFYFVAEQNNDLFRMFYECSNVRIEDGRIVPT